MGKKEADTKAIIGLLLEKGKTTFTMNEIESAITKICWVSDKRSYKNKFDLMWKLELFTQPQPGIYHLNLREATRLDIKIDLQQNTLLTRININSGRDIT